MTESTGFPPEPDLPLPHRTPGESLARLMSPGAWADGWREACLSLAADLERQTGNAHSDWREAAAMARHRASSPPPVTEEAAPVSQDPQSGTEDERGAQVLISPVAPADTGCPFCKRIEAGEYDYDDLHSVAFQPLNPVTPGHFLVVPRAHVPDALADPGAAAYAMKFAADLAAQMELDACNFITSAGSAASQTVWHLHLHVVPRRPGDGLALPWPQDPKCSYCYCRLADAPECAGGCAHRDPSGHVGCGLNIPPSAELLRRSQRKPVRGSVL